MFNCFTVTQATLFLESFGLFICTSGMWQIWLLHPSNFGHGLVATSHFITSFIPLFIGKEQAHFFSLQSMHHLKSCKLNDTDAEFGC